MPLSLLFWQWCLNADDRLSPVEELDERDASLCFDCMRFKPKAKIIIINELKKAVNVKAKCDLNKILKCVIHCVLA